MSVALATVPSEGFDVYTSSMPKAPHPGSSLEVGVRELRDRLSHYLAEVADGRAVVVTDRGRPVARLTGVDQIPDGWQRLIDDGLIRMPAKKATSATTWRKVKATGGVADLLEEQRR